MSARVACAIRDTLRAPEPDADQRQQCIIAPDREYGVHLYTIHGNPNPWRRYGLDMCALTAIERKRDAAPGAPAGLRARVRRWLGLDA